MIVNSGIRSPAGPQIRNPRVISQSIKGWVAARGSGMPPTCYVWYGLLSVRKFVDFRAGKQEGAYTVDIA